VVKLFYTWTALNTGGQVLRTALTIAVALILTSSACARSGGSDEPRPARSDGRVYVQVINRNALPMDVYALSGGINHRMGTVHPGMSSQFFLPQNLSNSSVRFEARTTGGGQPFRSGDLQLEPRAIVQFTIAAQLFSSTVDRRY
jgi:hypothetical protein